MATKEQITEALKSKGTTRRAWARVNGFNEETFLSLLRLYTNKNEEPNGKIFKKMNELFKKEFGFTINDKENTPC